MVGLRQSLSLLLPFIHRLEIPHGLPSLWVRSDVAAYPTSFLGDLFEVPIGIPSPASHRLQERYLLSAVDLIAQPAEASGVCRQTPHLDRGRVFLLHVFTPDVSLPAFTIYDGRTYVGLLEEQADQGRPKPWIFSWKVYQLADSVLYSGGMILLY